MKFLFQNRIIRFLLSGGTAAGVELVIFIILISFDTAVLVANSLSFMCGLVTSYTLNRVWVYRSSGSVKKQFGAYLVLAIINLIISNVVVGILVHNANVQPHVAKFIAMGLVAFWNYTIFSKVIFKR